MGNWNQHGFFSGITEDYSNYRWYKGETENPYKGSNGQPLAHLFWDYEREFHFAYLEAKNASKSLKESYIEWKKSFISEHLPGKSPHPFGGDDTDWEKVFETGRRD